MLDQEPILLAPDFDRLFKLAVDAGDVGVEAVLLQEDEAGINKPVSYCSKKLSRHQTAYSTIEKEALALVLAVQQFEVYIAGSPGDILVFTEHDPSTSLKKFKVKKAKGYSGVAYSYSHTLSKYFIWQEEPKHC